MSLTLSFIIIKSPLLTLIRILPAAVFLLHVSPGTVLLVNQAVQLSVVKKQNFFCFFFLPHRKENGKLHPAVSALGTSVGMKPAGIDSSRNLSLFLHRNKMFQVIFRIFVGTVVPNSQIRQGV